MNKIKYSIGQVVGVCGDRMYEFEITHVEENVYGGKCIYSADKKGFCKKGSSYEIKPEQITCLLAQDIKEYKKWKKMIKEKQKVVHKKKPKTWYLDSTPICTGKSEEYINVAKYWRNVSCPECLKKRK